jgi:eukaryotic-like serine/threonine-protein kinase
MNARLIGDPIAPHKRNPNLSLKIEEIILRTLARDPADRYPSAAAMKVDLEAPDGVIVTGRAGWSSLGAGKISSAPSDWYLLA